MIDAVGAVAEELGASRAAVALAWLLTRPAVASPIIGASKPHHLDEALAALELTLAPEQLRRLEADYVPHAVAGF